MWVERGGEREGGVRESEVREGGMREWSEGGWSEREIGQEVGVKSGVRGWGEERGERME